MNEFENSMQDMEEIEKERKEFSKTYRRKDGIRIMAVSTEPIHYWDETKQCFEEFDNELKNGAKGLYTHKGKCKITLPDGKENCDTVNIKKGDYKIEWKYLGSHDSMAQKNFPAPRVDYLGKDSVLKTNGSKKAGKHPVVQYNRIEDGIDIEYEIHNGHLKENIIIKKTRDNYEFLFRLKAENVVATLSEDKKIIEFRAKNADGELGDLQFRIPQPFLYDSNGQRSHNAVYDLKEDIDGHYLFKILVDSVWMNDKKRAYPVTLDPILEYTETLYGDITFENEASGFNGIVTGISSDGKTKYSSHLTASIPNISDENASISSAELSLFLKDYSTTNNMKYVLYDNNGNKIEERSPHENYYSIPMDVTRAILSATRSGASICEFTVSSYIDSDNSSSNNCNDCCDNETPIGNEDDICYSLTRIAAYSADNCETSTGSGDDDCDDPIPDDDECGGSDDGFGNEFGENSSNTTVTEPVNFIEFYGYATLNVYYRYSEEYMDNQCEVSSDNDFINLSTGKIVYQQEDVSTGSTAFPFSVSHYFDTDKRTEETNFGKGWHLSLEQRLENIDGGNRVIAKFTDDIGKTHYFMSGSGGYTDTAGLNLIYNKSAMTITDRSGGKLTFNTKGYLQKIEDASGNYLNITYNTSNKITKATDNFGRTITMRYSNSRLTNMTDPSGRTVSYTYDSAGCLTKITYPDASTSTFAYDNYTRLIEVKRRDNIRVKYTYDTGHRVTKTEKYPEGVSVAEEYTDFEYRSTRSTAVKPRTGIRKVYVFDDVGRAVLTYEDVPMDVDGTTITNRFQVTGTAIYQYTNKKRTFASSIRTAGDENNMITNGSFEDFEDFWQSVGMNECSDGIVKSVSADQHSAFGMAGESAVTKYLKQTIDASDIHLTVGDTLILSAWAKATSGTTVEDGSRKFEIRAEAHYTDNTTVTENARYDCEYTDWQYAALPIRIDTEKMLEYVTVYLDYSKNSGYCYFDNVRLVNAPAQSSKHEENLSESLTVFGTVQTIKERSTVHDGIYTTVSEKNAKYDVVRQTVTDLNGKSFVSVYEYDSAHHVTRTQNDRNIISETTYNSKGMPTSSKTYYWSVFNPDFKNTTISPTEYFKTERTYDSTGEFEIAVSDNRSADIKVENNYDTVKGLLTNTTTPNGQTTSYTYDSATDLVTKVTAAVGGATYSVVYGYTNRNLTKITHNGFDYGFTYDGMGRTKKVQIAGTTYSENTYTLAETTTVSTEYASGEIMTVETDRHEQPVKKTYCSESGSPVVIAEGEYDALGKAIRVLDKISNEEYTYTYDGYDNVTSEKVNGSAFKTYVYDNHNRLASTTVKVGGVSHVYKPIYETRADGAIYADNTVIGMTLDGIFTAKTTKDNLGRIAAKTLTPNGKTTALLAEEYAYLYTQAGFEKRLTSLVQTLTRKVNGTAKDALAYTYDNNGNITEIKNGNTVLAKYTYDGLNQLIREDNAVLNRSYVFTYDTAGNILSKKEYAYTTGTLDTVLTTKTYAYATSGWKDRLTKFDGESIEYDALGNPTTYRGYDLTWNLVRNLTGFGNHVFSYNASGIRTGKDDITYEYDGDKIVREIRPNAVLRYFYDTIGVCGFQYSNNNYYFMRNMQGDITAIYDTDGNIMAEYVYDAWGNHTITTDIGGIGTLNPFRYRGYYFDTETGLYYLKSRYYDPQTGRFINADSVEYLGADGTLLSYNIYAYCMNNPFGNIDSNGHFGITATIIIGALVGATIGLGSTAFADYKDDGEIFNGSISTNGYIANTLVGGVVGGLLGWIGASTFTFTYPTIKCVTTSIGTTQLVMGTATAIVKGTSILIGAGLLGLAGIIMFAKGSGPRIGHNQHEKQMWEEAKRLRNIKDKDLAKRIHNQLKKFPYAETLSELLDVIDAILSQLNPK